MIYADYNYITSKDNITYTIDMIRIKTSITVQQFDFLIAKLTPFDCIKKYYHCNSITEFRENYVIELSENSSFWFGFIHGSEIYKEGVSLQNENSKYNFTIEFNPNKIPLDYILKSILRVSTNWVIKSVDMAIDIPINILDLCGFDKGRKKDIRVFSQGLDNKTVYIGRSNNRIKIYNKKIESSLDNELTRVELTSKLDLDIKDISHYHYNVALPELFLNEYLYTFKDYEDKTLGAILFAVQKGFSISDLSRRYQDKVKKLLNGGYRINLDNFYCTEVFRKCFFNIFPYIAY